MEKKRTDVAGRDLPDLLNDALPLWAEVSDTRPESTSYRIRLFEDSWTQNDFELRRALDDLNASRVLDPTDTTTILLLRGMLEDLLRDSKISLGRLIRDPDAHALIEHLRDLLEITSAPACVTAVEEARRGHRAALGVYLREARRDDGAGRADATADATADPADRHMAGVDTFLADDHALGHVRLAAARSLDTLCVHQMTRGRRSGRRLRLNEFVHVFDAPSTFLKAIERTLDASVSLALIYAGSGGGARIGSRGTPPHFAIGVRDGEVLHLLTDLERTSHPDRHAMGRRPDRELERRAALHFFPYRLLGGTGDGRVDRPGGGDVAIEALVPTLKARVLCHLSLLSPAEITWLIMVADQVASRSLAGDLEREQISYLGDSIHEAIDCVDGVDAIEASSTGSSGPSELAPTSTAPSGSLGTLAQVARSGVRHLVDVTLEGATPEAACVEVMVGHNAWLEARYRGEVPHDAIEVLSPSRIRVAERALVAPSIDPPVAEDDLASFFEADDGLGKQISLRTLSADLIGSLDEVRADAHWCARQNIIRVVRRLAAADFDRDRGQILAWYTARVANNPEIERAIARGSWILPSCAYASRIPSEESFPRPDRLVWEDRECLRTYERGGKWTYPLVGAPRRTLDGHSVTKLDLVGDDCVLLGSKGADGFLCRGCEGRRQRIASVVFEIAPDNHRALAHLAGVPEADLPWQVQHWVRSEPYAGNDILDRIDPQDLMVDPWNGLAMRVVVGFCRPCLTALRRREGVDSNMREGTDET